MAEVQIQLDYHAFPCALMMMYVLLKISNLLFIMNERDSIYGNRNHTSECIATRATSTPPPTMNATNFHLRREEALHFYINSWKV